MIHASSSWGRAISGPVLALLGLVFVVCQSIITDSKRATDIFKYLSWATLGAAGCMLFVAQYEVWKQEREELEAAKKRLVPKVIIKNLTPRVWPVGQGGITVTGKEYYFDVFNFSEGESLENVRVEVSGLIPDAIGYPNPPLHVRNDESYRLEEFEINPKSARQIDLITGPVNAPNSQQLMVVPHILSRYRTAIPHGRYKITIRVSARNTTPITADFETWVDDDKELQCVMILASGGPVI